MCKPEKAPDWLELLDHTADVGVRVRAPTYEQLFERAAWGMFSLLTDIEKVKKEKTFKVAVAASDPEALMREWLSELNVLHVSQQWLFCTFEVLSATATGLAAEVTGQHMDGTAPPVGMEIKGVTFHKLRIFKARGVWHARVIFDI